MLENQRNIEKYNYEYLKELECHAKNYDFVSDKKEFLKNVSPYEHKIILLHSKNPYEVLNYLDELDIKLTRELLSELTYDEIEDILLLFSSEDKEKFYNTFSDLDLVNQFIVQDENSSEYIDDLSFDRKVELIDASTQETVEATSIVYESIPNEQKEYVSSLVNDSDAVSALSIAEDNIDISKNENSNEQHDFDKNVNKDIEFEIKKDIIDLKEKQEFKYQEKQEKQTEIVKSDNKNLKNEDIKEYNDEKNDINSKISQSSNEKDKSLKSKDFNQAKQNCKNAMINKIKQDIEQKNNNQQNNIGNEISKTL